MWSMLFRLVGFQAADLDSGQYQQAPHGRDLPIPSYATAGSAGVDLLAAVQTPVELKVGERHSYQPASAAARFRGASPTAIRFGA